MPTIRKVTKERGGLPRVHLDRFYDEAANTWEGRKRRGGEPRGAEGARLVTTTNDDVQRGVQARSPVEAG